MKEVPGTDLPPEVICEEFVMIIICAVLSEGADARMFKLTGGLVFADYNYILFCFMSIGGYYPGAKNSKLLVGLTLF